LDEAVFSANNGWNTLKEGLGYQYGSWLGWKRSRGAEDLEGFLRSHLPSSPYSQKLWSAFKRQ